MMVNPLILITLQFAFSLNLTFILIGFLGQLINLDNELRLEREFNKPKKVRLSSLKDKYRLPLSWHTEFWMPNEVSEEELGFPLVPMGQCLFSLKRSEASTSTSVRSSRNSSKRNSFRAGLCSDRSRGVSRRSSIKRSRPESICDNEDNSEWEWVWETDSEDDEVEDLKIDTKTRGLEEKLKEVNNIIARPEENWRRLLPITSPGSSTRSSFQQKGTITAQIGVEDQDPLSMVKVASAKQWKNISRKLTINFDDLEDNTKESTVTPKANFEAISSPPSGFQLKTPFEEALEEAKAAKEKAALEAKKSKMVGTPGLQAQVPVDFKPTTVQELRRLCWQIKPWDHPRTTFAERQLFTSILATPWGVDADEVHPRILVGDQAAARHIAFLKRFGITHVLNAAQGPWTEHCVDITPAHYEGTGITYLVRAYSENITVKSVSEEIVYEHKPC